MTPPNMTENWPADSLFDEGGVPTGRPCGVDCPSCSVELVSGNLVDCQFAGCPKCGGMLFQQPVFAALLRHLRSASNPDALMPEPMDPKELQIHRCCPACGYSLDTHPYGGPGNSVIDTCLRCSLVWLDHGELSKLVHAPGRR